MSGKFTNLMNVRKPIEMCKEVGFLETIAKYEHFTSIFSE